ncbi:MAG TPA: hypothetical protein VKJ01_03550, partial [Candidatus Solibacter sp.]|nr:hypothetical protein [Candidatus Solibacter sp.]
LQLDLRWKLVRRRRVIDTGTGFTLDLSSSGILLEAGRYLPPGLNLELLVSWPVLHRNVSPLQLFVSGRIVRSEGSLAAIQMVQHEFRTAGVEADQHEGAGRCVPELTSLLTK